MVTFCKRTHSWGLVRITFVILPRLSRHVTMGPKKRSRRGPHGHVRKQAGRNSVQATCLLVLSCLLPARLAAQAIDTERLVPILTGSAVFFTNVKAARRGKVADTQCALNVHSLTRSHNDMLKSKTVGGHSRRLRDLLRPVPGWRFCTVLQR